MKQLILLAGLHKTGTTSIQLSCAAGHAALREAGYVYPVERKGSHRANHTTLLNVMFRESPLRGGLTGKLEMGSGPAYEALYRNSRAQAVPVLERITSNLILAAEGVSLFSVDELASLKNWFVSRGWDIRVICQVRHLSTWISSMIGQRVVSPLRYSIPGAVDEFLQYGGIVRPRIENLRAVFPHTEFYSHEETVRHPQGPAGFFFQSIELPNAQSMRTLRANEGKSNCGTRALSLIFERFGQFDASGAPNPDACVALQPLDAMRQLPGKKFTVRQTEVAPILAMLQAENEWLRATLGEKFFDPHLQFGEVPTEWAPQVLAQLRDAVRALPVPVRKWFMSNLGRLHIPTRQNAPYNRAAGSTPA